MYTMYIKPLEEILTKLNVQFHLYADDCVIYLSFQGENSTETQARLNACLTEINIWMTENFLKLNTDKTKLQVFNPRSRIDDFQLKYEDENINCDNLVCMLGVKLKNNINFDDFISQKIRACNFHLRNLWHIKNGLSLEARVILVTNLILTTLDYCNGILINSTKKRLKPLQIVLNKAIRFIFNLRRRTHITSFLRKLHILPIAFRIRYKVCLIGFKIFNNISPPYLSDQFNKFHSTSSMPLRVGRDDYMFKTELQKKESIFSSMKLEWNKLPIRIRNTTSTDSFKSKLKTFLFGEAFPE